MARRERAGRPGDRPSARRGAAAGIRATRPLPTNRDAAPASDEDVVDLDRDLGELVDEDRRARAVEGRRHADLRRAVERDSATLAGLLRDLAEHGLAVVLEHEGGRLAGRVVAIGPDCVVLDHRGAEGRSVVRTSDLLTVTTEPGASAPDVRSHRDLPSDLHLREVLAAASEERLPVRLHLRGRTEALGGRLRAVGEDVVTIAAEGTPAGRTFVPLERVVRVDLDHPLTT